MTVQQRHETGLPVSPPMVGWYRLAVLVVAHLLLALFINGLLFQEPALTWLTALSAATASLVQPTLVANALVLALIVGVGLNGWCRIPLRQLGWRYADFLRALGILVVWVVLWQLCLGAMAWWAHGALPDARPTRVFSTQLVGRLIGQLFGNALYEETFFRAFLFSQFFLLLSQKTTRRRAIVGAALASQVIFALSHLPNRLLLGKMDSAAALVADQRALFLFGLIMLLLWWRLHNLWLVVGLHAVNNAPFSLFQFEGMNPNAVWDGLLFALAVFALYPPAARWMRRWT